MSSNIAGSQRMILEANKSIIMMGKSNISDQNQIVEERKSKRKEGKTGILLLFMVGN